MYSWCHFRIKNLVGNFVTANSLSVICSRSKFDTEIHYCVLANCYESDSELLFVSLKTPEEAYKLVDEVCKKYPYTDSDYVDYETLPMFEHPLYIQNF